VQPPQRCRGDPDNMDTPTTRPIADVPDADVPDANVPDVDEVAQPGATPGSAASTDHSQSSSSTSES
jgi:hypothetical protein